MSRRFQRQSPSGGVMSEPGRGITFDWGTTVPADGVVGYAPGCIFLDIDASAGSQFFVNTGTVTSAAFKTVPVRTGQTWKVGGGRAKVGGSAGWVVGAANDLGTIATMAASQTGGTLVVPVTGLHVGDTITGFGVYSSINSAGGTVTLDAALRKLVVAAGATATDSSIGSITQVSVTSATASSATKTGLTETVAAGTQYYLLLTGTTAGSTTIELDGLEVTVTTS